MRISIYLLTTSHTHLLLTTPTSHTHRFHPLSKIVIHTSAHPYCTEVWMTILESGWNLWVWLVGLVSWRWVWLVVRRYIYIDILTMIINFPYSTCINSFFGICIPTSSFIFKMFFRSCFCYFFTIYSKVTQRTFEIVQTNRDSANFPGFLKCVFGLVRIS